MTVTQYALITGAGSDLGKALALRFAREGYSLVLIDREATKLIQVEAEVGNLYPTAIIIVIPKDLSSSDAASELYEELKEENILISAMINVPCVPESSSFAETNWSDDEKTIISNIHTVTHLTKLILREMLLREGGKILQIISTSSFIQSSLRAVYGATQSFQLFFAEALQKELADKNVSLTLLSLGVSEKSIDTVAEQIASGDVAEVDNDTIASIAFQSLLQGKKNVIAGFRNESTGIDQLIPDSWSVAITNKFTKD